MAVRRSYELNDFREEASFKVVAHGELVEENVRSHAILLEEGMGTQPEHMVVGFRGCTVV